MPKESRATQAGDSQQHTQQEGMTLPRPQHKKPTPKARAPYTEHEAKLRRNTRGMNHTRARCDQMTIHPRVPASTLKLNPDSKRKEAGKPARPKEKQVKRD